MTKTKSIKTGILLIGVILMLIIGVKWIIQSMEKGSGVEKEGKLIGDLGNPESLYAIDTNRIADYYWKVNFDTILNREYLERGSMIDSISKSPNELIGILNIRPAKCKIEFIEITGDTLKIRILDDVYLTHQMGTLGAECYMAETIFTLTENNLIQFVRFEMDYGSHAGPGLYSRKDYERLLKK